MPLLAAAAAAAWGPRWGRGMQRRLLGLLLVVVGVCVGGVCVCVGMHGFRHHPLIN